MKFIGMDAHSSTSTFSVMNHEGIELDNVTMETNGRLLVNYLRGIEGKKRLALEECELSHWLYEILRPEVEELIVASPAHNRGYKKAKTDKLDARHLGSLLRGGFLVSVYHDGSQRERFRTLMSSYEDLIQEIVRIKCRYKSVFRKEGKVRKGKKIYKDPAGLRDVERRDYRFIGANALELLKVMEEQKKRYTREIEKESKRFKEIKYLKSIPGVGPIHAAKIVSQVIDPNRFKTKYNYYSYCGLARHRRSSGGRDYGSEKIHGNKILKSVYRTAGQSALRGKNELRNYYDRLRSEGKSHRHAYNGVCRKLAGISLSVWRKDKKYNNEYFLSNHLK